MALFLAKEVTGTWDGLGLPPVHFTYMAIGMFGIALLIMTIVSLVRPSPPADPSTRFHWSDLKPEASAKGRGLSWDYRTQATALAILMVAFIAVFW